MYSVLNLHLQRRHICLVDRADTIYFQKKINLCDQRNMNATTYLVLVFSSIKFSMIAPLDLYLKSTHLGDTV